MKYFLVFALTFVATLFFIKKCSIDVNGYKSYRQNEIKVLKTKNGNLLNAQRQNTDVYGKILDSISKENEKLNSINQFLAFQSTTNFRRDTVYIKETDTINKKMVVKVIDSTNYMKLPYTFSNFEEKYGYQFTIDSNRFYQDSLYFKSNVKVSFGEKRVGFFQKERYVTIEDKNKYTTITGMQNYTIPENKNKINLGVSLGYGVTPQGLSPALVFGINYNIFQIN